MRNPKEESLPHLDITQLNFDDDDLESIGSIESDATNFTRYDILHLEAAKEVLAQDELEEEAQRLQGTQPVFLPMPPHDPYFGYHGSLFDEKPHAASTEWPFALGAGPFAPVQKEIALHPSGYGVGHQTVSHHIHHHMSPHGSSSESLVTSQGGGAGHACPNCGTNRDLKSSFDLPRLHNKRKHEDSVADNSSVVKSLVDVGQPRVKVFRAHPTSNTCTSKKKKGLTSSKYNGVCWNKRKSKWRARLANKGEREFLGDFETEEEAAAAFDARIKELFPQNFLQKVNFLEDGSENPAVISSK